MVIPPESGILEAKLLAKKAATVPTTKLLGNFLAIGQKCDAASDAMKRSVFGTAQGGISGQRPFGGGAVGMFQGDAVAAVGLSELSRTRIHSFL